MLKLKSWVINSNTCEFFLTGTIHASIDPSMPDWTQIKTGMVVRAVFTKDRDAILFYTDEATYYCRLEDICVTPSTVGVFAEFSKEFFASADKSIFTKRVDEYRQTYATLKGISAGRINADQFLLVFNRDRLFYYDFCLYKDKNGKVHDTYIRARMSPEQDKVYVYVSDFENTAHFSYVVEADGSVSYPKDNRVFMVYNGSDAITFKPRLLKSR